ncbi:MAG: DNA polymerase IV [Burkholderiaceae bacterium]
MPASPPNTDPAAPVRRFAHLDMDAFYASVELLRRPDLRGQPVAIGGRGDPNSRGVVTTATYEARKFGIHSGMALARAVRLCPQCVFLPVDFEEYRRQSRRFKAAVAEITPRYEDRGIDEIYIDFDAVHDAPDGGRALAERLQRQVRERCDGLTCSIGVAPNKLLAKIASDMDKPAGITVLEFADVPGRLWPLPVRVINGIGPKAEQRLQAMGIEQVGQLAQTGFERLREHFGQRYSAWLIEAAHGRDQRTLSTHSEPVSRSRETTFERDLHLVHDAQRLDELLSRLAGQVAGDLARGGHAGRTIGIKARYDDFRIVTRDVSLNAPTANAQRILEAARHCLARVTPRRRLRLLGVRVAGLVRTGSHALHAADVTGSRPEPYTPDLFAQDDRPD